jgi:N-methylhydantoinase A/oxoprolinase/acetone carboxylase beta subunit
MKRIGVDVGGTFTDLIYRDDVSGATAVHKVPSTPADPSVGTLDGIRALCAQAGVEPAAIDMLFHGTTVATNIVLQHSGARVGLITNRGFRDILHIARKKRPLNFSSYQDVPWQTHPLVQRRHRKVVSGRILADGSEHTPLDLDEVRQAARELREAGVEAVAVCLLFSFVNPSHEEAVRAVVEEEMPGVFLSVSSSVVPQYREYERFSTTALNAFIGPAVSRYVENLAAAARAADVVDEVHLMTSAGGVVTARGASSKPVSLLMSGPVAGVIAGIEYGRASGSDSVITLDVGGTSADIGVAPEGRLRMRHLLDTKVGAYDAMVPMVDLDTIGAGGGSIASIDPGGIFRVGPRSAGAEPGPVCYGRGGTEPTTTDAVLTLGYLRPTTLLGGEMQIDREAAREAIRQRIAERLDLSVEQAAMGIFQILVASMVDAISLNSVRKGYDPRDFALVPEGGAGGLFAWAIAERMQIPRVIVPRHPGVAAAVGLLTTDMRYEYPSTVWQFRSGADLERLAVEFERLEAQAREQLRADGVADGDVVLERSADCRYVGQGYELRVGVPAGPLDAEALAAFTGAFEDLHERTYFNRFEGTDVQIINVRVTGVGRVPRVEITPIESGGEDASAAATGIERVLFADAEGAAPTEHETTFYARDRLRAGNRIAGPAVIEQFDATTVIGPGQEARVDRVGHLIIERSEA